MRMWFITVLVATSVFQICTGNIINSRSKEWERGVVVYDIQGLLSQKEQVVIMEAMREIENDTRARGNPCLVFRPKTGSDEFDPDYVFIQKTTDNFSSADIGKIGGKQHFKLTNRDIKKTTVMAYLLHIAGLFHEHNRPDRDQYIAVHDDNIQHSQEYRFRKLSPTDTDVLGLHYDFDSLTHFGPYEFAADIHLPTITSNRSDDFGYRKRMSVDDVLKVQTLYICGKDTTHIISRPPYPVDCNFEQVLCNLADDYQDDFDWLRQSSQIAGGGPSGDFDSGTGFYIYANGSNHVNHTAQLLSAREITPGSYCISMRYYIVGDADLSISVYDYVLDKTVLLQTISSNTGPNKGLWYELTSQYDNYDHKWRVNIKGTPHSDSSGIAIDEVKVYPGVCF